MHDSYKNNHKTWVIKEAYSGEVGAGFGSEEDCKKQLPWKVVSTAGLNWKTVQKAWIDSGCQGQTPCDLNEAKTTGKTNLVLRNYFCKGWRPGDTDASASGAAIDNANAELATKEVATTPETTKITPEIIDWFQKNLPTSFNQTVKLENIKMVGDKLGVEMIDGANYTYLLQDGTYKNFVKGDDGKLGTTPTVESTWAADVTKLPAFPSVSTVTAGSEAKIEVVDTETGL